MKIKIEFDLTPQEFRETMGWPDVTELQQQVVDDFHAKMMAGEEGYDPMSLMKPYLAQSTMTMASVQKAVSSIMESYFRSGDKK